MTMPDASAGPSVQEEGDQALRALFDRARAGDAQALDALCRAMRPRLYRAAFAIVRDADEADDLAQEALVRAVTRRFLFLGTGSVSGWMAKIAINLAKNRLRDSKRRKQILEGSSDAERAARGAQPGAAAHADAALADKQSRARLDAALTHLTERQRQVVELRVIGDLSFTDVAAALGITEPNARVTFSQAKKRLLDAVSGSHDTSPPGGSP